MISGTCLCTQELQIHVVAQSVDGALERTHVPTTRSTSGAAQVTSIIREWRNAVSGTRLRTSKPRDTCSCAGRPIRARWRFVRVGTPRSVAACTFECKPAARGFTNCCASFNCQRVLALRSGAQAMATALEKKLQSQSPKMYNRIAACQVEQRSTPSLLIRALLCFYWRATMRCLFSQGGKGKENVGGDKPNSVNLCNKK